jgi:ubiquitin carboxyl-terminal hydrolase 34
MELYTSEVCYAMQIFHAEAKDAYLNTSSRNSDFLSFEPTLRSSLVVFSEAFARMTAHITELDYAVSYGTLRDSDVSSDVSPGDLLSNLYLRALGDLVRGEPSRLEDLQRRPHLIRHDEISAIVDAFHLQRPGFGGSMSLLCQLLSVHAEVISRFPKLIDDVGHISAMALIIARETERNIELTEKQPQPQLDTAKKTIVSGQKFFVMASQLLETLLDKQLTAFSPDSASQMIASLADLLHLSLRQDNPEARAWLEEHQLPLAISKEVAPEVCAMEWRYRMLQRLIMCSQMPLRVMANTNLCTELVTCWKKFGDSPENMSDEGCVNVLRYIADILVNTGLVAYLLGPSCHPEITAEAGNIIGFLAVTKTYRMQHSDRLWETITSTQDPRISEALIRMMGRITNLFAYDVIVYLCAKLESLPVEAFNNVMREYCEGIFKHICVKPDIAPPETDQTPYRVCLRFLRVSSVVGPRSPAGHPELQKFAVDRLLELLNNIPLEGESRQAFCTMCLEDIEAKSSTTVGSMCALTILSRASHGQEFENLTASHNLTSLVVAELEHAADLARGHSHESVISGAANMPRRDIIFQILLNHSSTVTKDLGQRLWDTLVGSNATCREDRDEAWKVLNMVLSSTRRLKRSDNPFLETCFAEYLPRLPPMCFCEGMLEFVRDGLLPIINETDGTLLDDADDAPERNGLEQIWRIILTAPSQTVERYAINTLVSDIYINSRSITSFSMHRARKVHLTLVARCLSQLSRAASRLGVNKTKRATSEDDEMMLTEEEDVELQAQKLVFVRSLAVLREFHRLYRAKGTFAAPDLRSLISTPPDDIDGDSAELKFQSFDGDDQTDVRPLHIGMRNTAAALLASLKEATGFENYRIFYKGRAFVPQESDICKSLEDLQIHNGLILVKREANSVPSLTRIRPGTSSVDVEVLSHFDELWEYLSMEDQLAQEVYSFLVCLPLDEHILGPIRDESVGYRSVFAVGQPFKSLYAAHALRQYLVLNRQATTSLLRVADHDIFTESANHSAVLRRVASLTIAAICDHEVLGRTQNLDLQLALSISLVEGFAAALKDAQGRSFIAEALDSSLIDPLLQILSLAVTYPDKESAVRLVLPCLQAIFDCCSISRRFWEAFCQQRDVDILFGDLLLHEWDCGSVRKITAKLVGERITFSHSSAVVSPAEFREIFWPLVTNLIPKAMLEPSKCEEVFSLAFSMMKLMSDAEDNTLDLDSLLNAVSRWLLSYSTFEVSSLVSPYLHQFNS